VNLPEKVQGYAWVPNPDRLLSDLGKFSQNLDIPPLAIMGLQMMLGGLLENSNLTGVDMDGPLCLVSFSPEAEDSWAVCFSLTNPDIYLKALSKTLKLQSEDDKTGIRVYTKEVKTLDAEAFAAASPEEQKKMGDFYKTSKKSVSVAINKKSAWLSPNQDILKQLYRLTPVDFKAPVDGSLAVVLKVQPLLDFLEPLAKEKLEKFEMTAAEAPSPLGENVARELLNSYIDLSLYYGRQVRTFAIGLTINGDGVELYELIEAEPDSSLEEFLKAQKKGELSLARYLDDSSWMVFDGRIQRQDMLIELYRKLFDIFGGVFKELDTGKDEKTVADQLAAFEKTFLKNLQIFINCSGDEMAFSISSSPAAIFSAVSVQKITDPKAYREYIKKSYLESIDIMMPFYQERGVGFDLAGIKEPETYKGVEIFTAKITFDLKKLLKKEELSEDEKRGLSLLEAPMIIQSAATGRLAVTEMSWGGKPDIKTRLDLIAAGKSSFDLKELNPCRKDANGVLLISIDRFLKDYLLAIMKKLSPPETEAGQAEVLERLGALDLPILACYTVDGANLKIETGVAMDKIRAVKVIIEKIKKATPEKPGSKSE